MIDLDKWQEIFHTLRQNKLRTILTAFGVFWGIFMLVIMLGAGSGLQNAVYSNMKDFAKNSMFIWSQPTTKPYKGFSRNRSYNFDYSDIEALRQNVPELDIIAATVNGGGFRATSNISYGIQRGAYQVRGIMPEENRIDPVNIKEGRFLNELDLMNNRKVVLIGKRVYEELFKSDEEAVDKFIRINGSYFQVIGVFSSKHSGGWGEHQNTQVFIPFTTAQRMYNYPNKVDHFSLSAHAQYNSLEVEKKVKALLAKRHDIHPEDEGAMGSNNVGEEFKKMNGLFLGIRVLVWIVGIGTLVAGVIGVSNIMLIIIKERTQEIGIKRAIGATPRKIISNIISESIFLTALAGTIGMSLGILIIDRIDKMIDKNGGGGEDPAFLNPEIDVNIAITALIVLIISGLFAGVIPSKRAVSIKPIDAIRSE